MKKLHELKTDICRNIRRIRAEKKISTVKLAQLSRISESTIYECQRPNPRYLLNLLAFIRIAYALGVSLEELLKENK